METDTIVLGLVGCTLNPGVPAGDTVDLSKPAENRPGSYYWSALNPGVPAGEPVAR